MHRITAAEIATYQADRYLRRKEQIERLKNEPPQLGPRTKFIHYIYDEHLLMKDAIQKIIDEFPDLSENGKIDTIERDEERVEEAKKNIKDMELEDKINIYVGDAVEVLPTLNEKYDMVFIDAAKGKYPFFLAEALRMLAPNGIIFADNILYKGYVMSDYNKHKQRTAVRNLREYIAETTENPLLDTEILEVGDGLAITKLK